MRHPLPTLLAAIAVAAAPAVAAAQANKPLPPGIYFLWSPPGPQTVTPDHPILPNTDWVAEQSGRTGPQGMAVEGPSGVGVGPRRLEAVARSGARYLFGHPWYRIATATPGAKAPDLWIGGTDHAAAGRDLTLWVSNEGVTRQDQVYVSVRIDRSGPAEDEGHPVFTTTSGALPPGAWESKVPISLGSLPAGTYRVTIETSDPITGQSGAGTRTLLIE